MRKINTFETSYPEYAFAPLVSFGIWVASFLSSHTHKSGTAHGARSVMGNSFGSAA